ncbi:unnamed protein product [Sphagnum jensenii]|uniref:Uncharacterized protein n=1 Tax=Sphagnum jensenii TaxID=128206 RepID=A0ABP1BY26_9BRYO
MATAVPSTSFTGSLLRRSRSSLFGGGLQTLRVSSLRVPGVSLRAVQKSVCSKLSSSSSSTDSEQSVAVGAMFTAMTMPDSAMASQQLMALAADDSRGFALLLPLVPALGWVLFNILQPGLNQFNRMRGIKAVAAGAGLGAALTTMMLVPQASAAQEIATLAADSDSRGLVLLGILVPAVAWVLYNILQPGLNQLDKMRSSKAVVGALGLGAVSSMYLTPQAEAIQEIATIADNDSRGLVLLGILLPALGWVLFNILQPGLNQLNKMKSIKGLVVGAAGLGAAASSMMAAAPDAEAAQEITQLAADNRPLILLFILLPAIGWVLFNILQPALNQLNKMSGKK